MVEKCSYRRDQAEIPNFTNSNHHPSFSSTLLDAIYRSIDEGEEDMVIYREEMRKKCAGGANLRCGGFKSEEEMANFQRACMIEKWMEKKASEKVVVRRKSGVDFQAKKPRKDRENSSWSSSDSSCGGGGFFSSSEMESFPAQRPKAIRTGFKQKHRDCEFSRRESEQKPTKSEGGFSKTKLRALKIYGDLKKVKQPISPGGKLAGFLNSLFSGEKLRKHKISSDESPSLKSTNTSTCSSASSFSRSCLSKTPSSRGKTSTGAKRSVRFSPVSVIVDEDCRPCGHKSLHSEINYNKIPTNYSSVNIIRNAINDELMAHVMEKNRRVEEVARDLLRNYQRKNQNQNQNQAFDRDFDEELEDEDDDAASCASSDLFELDNLSAIGMERYREELPVYESTHLDSTVAKGLIY